MPFQYFLAVRLLKFNDDEFTQIHFGNGGNHRNCAWPESEIADAVAAFSHHAFLKKDRQFAFSDLQGK